MKTKSLLLATALLMSTSALAQKNTFKGVVLDDLGEPVIGATVQVKGVKGAGAITDLDGNFVIDADANQTLVITYIGYKDAEIRPSANMKITLKQDDKALDEVVVVGYGVQKKSVVTAAIAKVSTEDLAGKSPVRVDNALKGLAAGVNVTSSSGQPGASPKVRIRGTGTINNSDPLYIVDGMPIEGGLDYLNPSDIESIEVLKDAASGAIYGARAANGVVLVTTKKGKMGKAQINYNFSYGWQSAWKKRDVTSATDYAILQNERALNGGQAPIYADPYQYGKGTDWQDEVFGNAGMMRHNISVTGGSKAIRYMASVGYMDQDGIIAPSNHNRINARLNLDAQITKHFSASLSYSMYDVKNKVVQAEGRMINDGVIQSMLMYLPNLPAYEENGDYARSAMIRMVTDWGINFPENPLVIANELDISEKTSRHNLNFNLVYEPLPDLKISARLGQQWYNYRYFYYRPMSIGRNSTPAYGPELASYNIARSSSTYDIDRLGEFTASYKKQLGRHHVDALIGYTLQRKTYDRLGVQATGFADDRIHEVTAHGPKDSDVSLYETRKAAWSMMSYLARLNYSFDDRYTVTGTFRTDGSSRFGVNNRWGYFPSVSAGWTISNEPFLKDALENIATVRIRASWGKSGNNDIGNYSSIAGISTGSYAFGTTAVSTSRLGGFADSELGWETTTQTNIGLDLGFFNSRLNVIANYYNSISTDILYNAPISAISGFTSSTTNMTDAKIRNRGFDLQVDARLLTGKVKWNVSTNISINRNKVVSLGGLDDILSTSERSVQSHITKEGYPIGSFYGYKAVGIMSELDYKNALKDREVYLANGSKFPAGYTLQGPAVPSYALDDLSYGNTIWKDVSGDGVIDTNDKTILGNAYPDFTGGFSTSLSWKGFDLGASFTYSYGGEVINFQDYYLFNVEGSSNQYAIAADRYVSDTNPGRNNVPIATRISVTNQSLKLSSYYVEDASYFRCSNITLGYTLPKRLLRKIGVESCRVYVSGDNLFTITDYRGYNPEVSYKSSNLMPGFDWGCYPLSRIYSVGLNLTF